MNMIMTGMEWIYNYLDLTPDFPVTGLSHPPPLPHPLSSYWINGPTNKCGWEIAT